MEIDWQNDLIKIQDRCKHMLESEKLTDCRFLVGTSSNQRLFSGHKLFMAMASPVFERMFYGNLTEKNDPICIPDVQPDAFKALLDYIYTDEISILSFDNACELYSVAKKYMLPHVVDQCTDFLVAYLSPKNACRAYEFAKFHEEPHLIESSMKFITFNTKEVIADPSFVDIEVSILMDILDQDYLNIGSELDLFNGLLKLANKRVILEDSSAGAVSIHRSTIDEANLRQAVKKIRFLTMSPRQFADGPARSKLLHKDEVHAIFLKISNPTNNDYPMPEGFCPLNTRDYHENRYSISFSHRFCGSNSSNQTYSHLSFKVDTNIYILGVHITFRNSYPTYGFFAWIQNMHGHEIAYAFCEKAITDSTYELTFKGPVAIHRNEEYNIKIIDKPPRPYDLVLFSWVHEMVCEGVKFSITANPHGIYIRDIFFSK